MLAFVATAAVANSCPDTYSVSAFPNEKPPFSACATDTMAVATYAWSTFSTLTATEICTPATAEFECCLALFYSDTDTYNHIKCYPSFDATTYNFSFGSFDYEFNTLLPQAGITCGDEMKAAVIEESDLVPYDQGLAAVNCTAFFLQPTTTSRTTDSSVPGAELSTDTIVGISVGAAAGLGLVYGIISACA